MAEVRWKVATSLSSKPGSKGVACIGRGRMWTPCSPSAIWSVVIGGRKAGHKLCAPNGSTSPRHGGRAAKSVWRHGGWPWPHRNPPPSRRRLNQYLRSSKHPLCQPWPLLRQKNLGPVAPPPIICGAGQALDAHSISRLNPKRMQKINRHPVVRCTFCQARRLSIEPGDYSFCPFLIT